MSDKTTTYVRFPVARRIEHIVLITTFVLLATTGLPQKYPTSAISTFIVQLLGGIENLRDIHHLTSVLVMFAVMYHLLNIGYHIFVLRSKMSMMISLQDAKDGLQALLYNLGLAKSFPKMGRYTFDEKFEYWAFVWGYSVMGVTGFIMWNPITATMYLPGEFVPAAKAAHGGEAVLAVLAILIWHMYNVHIKRVNKSMWTGNISAEEIAEDHPLELEDIKSGTADRMPDPATLRRRQRVYFPIAAMLTLIMLTGIYTFATIEDTASSNIAPISSTQVIPAATIQP